MIEDIEKVSGEPRLDGLRDAEVFVERDISSQESGTLVKSLGVGIEDVTNRSIENASVCQLHGNAVVKIGSQWARDSSCRVHWYEGLQIAPGHVGGLGGIKISSKPQPLMATKNIHFDSLVGAQRGVTGHKKTRANTTPQPPAPIPKRGDLPTADQIIHSLTD